MADSTESQMLSFGGAEYDLDLIISLSRTAPKIEIDLADVHGLAEAKDTQATDEHHVAYIPPTTQYDDASAIVYKQHGGYVVLVGKKTVSDLKGAGSTVFSARLLSKHVLKRARIAEPETEQVEDAPRYTPPERPFRSTHYPRDREFRSTTQPRTSDYRSQTDRPAYPRKPRPQFGR